MCDLFIYSKPWRTWTPAHVCLLDLKSIFMPGLVFTHLLPRVLTFIYFFPIYFLFSFLFIFPLCSFCINSWPFFQLIHHYWTQWCIFVAHSLLKVNFYFFGEFSVFNSRLCYTYSCFCGRRVKLEGRRGSGEGKETENGKTVYRQKPWKQSRLKA